MCIRHRRLEKVDLENQVISYACSNDSWIHSQAFTVASMHAYVPECKHRERERERRGGREAWEISSETDDAQ